MQKQQHGSDSGVKIFQRSIKAQIRGGAADDSKQCESKQSLWLDSERFPISYEDPAADDCDRKKILVKSQLNRMSAARDESFCHDGHQGV